MTKTEYDKQVAENVRIGGRNVILLRDVLAPMPSNILAPLDGLCRTQVQQWTWIGNSVSHDEGRDEKHGC